MARSRSASARASSVTRSSGRGHVRGRRRAKVDRDRFVTIVSNHDRGVPRASSKVAKDFQARISDSWTMSSWSRGARRNASRLIADRCG